ncbi:MAG TPA: rhodanese-like domain-containing protein [Candidatus Krumholzibacteria bacterium]|nr:rhodanese-like domain-containing protein [Candidatus Krumholzibacteria bacterium]
MKSILFAAMLLLAASVVATGEAEKSTAIPEKKQTTLGLYVTAAQAYTRWEADSTKVRILDVRTPDEYVFVGHARMAWNIPFKLQTYAWDDSTRRFPMKSNPDFLARAKELFSPTDTLLVMCRSGGRSAMAVNALAQAGFTRVYSIVDGMEGDLDRDPASSNYGKRVKNGWKNAGNPWTYTIDPAKMKLPGTN